MSDRMPNYREPITPADTHPTGCVGCKVDAGPHKWTPPSATRRSTTSTEGGSS